MSLLLAIVKQHALFVLNNRVSAVEFLTLTSESLITVMKIVLTGSTGFAGSEVLQQCIQSQDVNSIIVLTRRPLNMTQSDAKVNNIIFEDFESYSPQTIEAISDADACIWLVSTQVYQS